MGSDKGVGVHQSYKEQAKNGCDVLFHVSIKGREMLVDNIPLHMSIKIFKSMDEFDLDELKEYVKEHDISSPDPQSLIFEPIIFEAETSKLKYYMLKIDGLHPKYKALYDKYDKVGNVYKQFMTHVTIDKELYDDIKENGITADDIEFGHLVLEEGAGNTHCDFGKSENFGKSDYGPKKLDLYSHADNARRKESRTGEVANVGPNKAVRAAGPTRSETAEHQARLDRQKSKKNPVKVYSPKERKKLARKMGVLAASEDMSKGIKHAIAGLAVAGAMTAGPAAHAPQQPPHKSAVSANHYDSGKMLNTISAVESSSGKNTHHHPAGGIHRGESAIGKYGMMPNTIRETISMHPDLKNKYSKATSLRGDDIRRYMEDNPGLEDAVAQRHLKRLEHHFGKDPAKIGYAWLEGIRGTYKATKHNQDINRHWHVKKIKDAYSKGK